ncbi:MAG: hypothetical protein ACO3EZ_12530, partial [Prochlorotrichaceae cyanobacterium]
MEKNPGEGEIGQQVQNDKAITLIPPWRGTKTSAPSWEGVGGGSSLAGITNPTNPPNRYSGMNSQTT